MPLIPTGYNADAYASGRGLALYQARRPAAVTINAGTPAWWSNEGIKDVWAGAPSRVGVETVFFDSDGRPMKVIGGPAFVIREAPPYIPRLPPTPPIQVGPGVLSTYELYGMMYGRKVPVWSELHFDGFHYQIKQGGRVVVAHDPSSGFGFGGTPGKWSTLYPTVSPSA